MGFRVRIVFVRLGAAVRTTRRPEWEGGTNLLAIEVDLRALCKEMEVPSNGNAERFG